jgi:hypothetical protein
MVLAMWKTSRIAPESINSERRTPRQDRGQTMTVAVDRGILARSSQAGRCSPGFG